jgi:hypothetical protein
MVEYWGLTVAALMDAWPAGGWVSMKAGCWAPHWEHEREMRWVEKRDELMVALRADARAGLKVRRKVGLMVEY